MCVEVWRVGHVVATRESRTVGGQRPEGAGLTLPSECRSSSPRPRPDTPFISPVPSYHLQETGRADLSIPFGLTLEKSWGCPKPRIW